MWYKDSPVSLEETADDATESDERKSETDDSDFDEEETKYVDRSVDCNCTSACCSDEVSDLVHPKPGSKVDKQKQGKQPRLLYSSWFSEYPCMAHVLCNKRKSLLFLL